MRHICVLVGCILAVLALSGCSPKEEDVPAIASSEFKTSDQLIQEAESREAQKNSSQEEQLYGEVAGVYVCRTQGVSEQFWPSLELKLDGQALFHANLLTGMGSLEGQYELKDDIVRLSVEQVSFTGFAGEKVTDMIFQADEKGMMTLSYTTPDTAVGITVAGDVFIKNS